MTSSGAARDDSVRALSSLHARCPDGTAYRELYRFIPHIVAYIPVPHPSVDAPRPACDSGTRSVGNNPL